MRRTLGILILTMALLLFAPGARSESEIVIAIRYLQAQGMSHSHLYLYREDGKLLRQLTNDNSCQEIDPIFAPNGETIVFTREKPNNIREFWSIEPRGTGLKKLDTAPDWYTGAKSSAYFTSIEPEETPEPNYKSPDDSFEMVLREDPKDEDDQIDGPGHGKHFLLCDLKSGTETEFGKIPGFLGAFDLLHDRQDKDRHFLFDGALRLAFFDLHLNSTDGDTVFALDLNGPRLVRLSPNWAAPIPLPGESAFLTQTENRYVPIPGSTKTANCSYLERWDPRLNKVRYAREKSAALVCGASMYRPNQSPTVISITKKAD